MQSIQSKSLSSTSNFKIITSSHFNDWLNQQYLSLAFTTYQAGKIFLIRLWLLNSGTGEFGYVDIQRGTFEPVVFCPGYLRGCAFSKNYDLVGLSRSRNKTFSGLLLDQKLEQTATESFCGLLVINLLTGKIIHWLKLEGIISELYDIAVLPKIRRPMVIGLKSDEIKRLITIYKL